MRNDTLTLDDVLVRLGYTAKWKEEGEKTGEKRGEKRGEKKGKIESKVEVARNMVARAGRKKKWRKPRGWT
jgi:hypothetical protein